MLTNILLVLSGIILALGSVVIFYYQGVLHVDISDPETDKYLLDLQDLDIIPKRKFILLAVQVKDEELGPR